MALTRKQERFVAEYLVDLNATQAAIRSGYSVKTAANQGHENLRKPEIASAVAAGQSKALERAELSATRTLEEARRIAFGNAQDFFDTDGNLIPIHKLTREQASSIASVEVVKKNLQAGDGHTDTIHKLKTWDKPRVLEQLMKHFGLLEDRVKHEGNFTIKWQD